MEGFLIYRRQDAMRNSHYITMYEEKGKKLGARVLLRYFEGFSFGTKKGRPTLFYQGEPVEKKPDFIIVRADVPLFSKRLESLGFLVFNNAYLSKIANDKEKTLRLAMAHDIPVPDTCFVTKETAVEAARNLHYPLVIKPPDGHGGADVFMLQNEEELTALIPRYEHARFLLQHPVSELGKDLRVYVVGNRIVAGMLRSRQDDFRSNYCLGGEAMRYDFSDEELALVNRVIALFDVDYAGFDFMFDKGKMVLNEIEDVVGARMLYHLTDVDVVALYLTHIIDKVQNAH